MPFKKLHSAFLPHNSVKLVKGGHEYFALLLQMIDNAKHSIHLQVYIFEADETGTLISKALIEAANRNVKVYAMVDGYASQGLSSDLISSLKNAGVYFRMFEPLLKSKHFYFGRRMHHKVVVIDGEYGMVGGLNISDRYNDMPGKPAWLDWALYVQGDAVSLLERICVKRFRYAKLKKKTDAQISNQLDISINEADCKVRVRENDWVGRKRQIYNSYLEMFRYATSEIIIMSPYFLPGNEFRKRMRLATKRGVRIKLVLAGLSDISISKYAERFVYRWLLKNNIEIYEYQKNVLHGKIAVCDETWLTVGSYNVNDLSAHASIELNLDVSNKHFAKHVANELKEIIYNDCVCITNEIYRSSNNVFTRILQRWAYDFFRLALFLFTFYFRQNESVKELNNK